MLQQLANLSQQYKLRLGSKLAVVITSPSLLKQVVRGTRDVVFSPPASTLRRAVAFGQLVFQTEGKSAC